MKLMMVCPTCNGLGVESVDYFVNIEESKVCGTCHGKAVVEPPQQILDDLECAEINNELVEKGFCVRYFKSIKFNCYKIDLYEPSLQSGFLFEGETPLKVYRKAKDWMDGRGAE